MLVKDLMRKFLSSCYYYVLLALLMEVTLVLKFSYCLFFIFMYFVLLLMTSLPFIKLDL